MLTRCIVTLAQVTSQPALRIVRTIPNTPVKVRRGSVAVTFSEGCSGQDKEVVTTIFSRWVHTAVHCPAFVLHCVCVVWAGAASCRSDSRTRLLPWPGPVPPTSTR